MEPESQHAAGQLQRAVPLPAARQATGFGQRGPEPVAAPAAAAPDRPEPVDERAGIDVASGRTQPRRHPPRPAAQPRPVAKPPHSGKKKKQERKRPHWHWLASTAGPTNNGAAVK